MGEINQYKVTLMTHFCNHFRKYMISFFILLTNFIFSRSRDKLYLTLVQSCKVIPWMFLITQFSFMNPPHVFFALNKALFNELMKAQSS